MRHFGISLAFQDILLSPVGLSHPGQCGQVLYLMVVMGVKWEFWSQGVLPSWISDLNHHL